MDEFSLYFHPESHFEMNEVIGFELIEEWDLDGDGLIDQNEYLATLKHENHLVEDNTKEEPVIQNEKIVEMSEEDFEGKLRIQTSHESYTLDFIE